MSIITILLIVIVALLAGMEGVLDEFQFHQPLVACTLKMCIRDSADVVHVADQPDVSAYDYIIFGCPAMGAEVLEESEFEPFFMQAEGTLMNKKVALFGSYGWGSGEWMQSWEERVEAAGANLFENGLIINYTPDADGLDACESLGERFANA